MNDKQERAQKTAVWLRKLADKYQGLADGRIKEGDKEVVEARMLVKLIRRVLYEDWL